MADKSCLYISHRGRGDSPPGRVARLVFENLVVPAVERVRGFSTMASHQHETEPGSISTPIVEDVLKADLVIFDLSELASDGYYLLGVRNAAQLPTVFIAEAEYVISFDFRDFRYFKYPASAYESRNVQEDLVRTIKEALETTPRPPGLSLPQKQLSPREMRTELGIRIQDAAEAIRLLRVNSELR
jgi:hypothetical protein